MKEKWKNNVLSIQDVIESYQNYDASEEAKEVIIYFVSELTGVSVDTLLANI